MVSKVLTNAGFVAGVTFKECRFLQPPKGTYAVYMDNCEWRGADDMSVGIKDHDYTIELYSSSPDPDAETRLENSLIDNQLEYTKQAREWLDDEGLYQVIYEFEYVEKI